ncbi:disease resistance protein RUN1-like [Rosa rugosa]|uniref:disease resistance protein RUN1-like n=1 Tax=Rosa rugosa TaxID=74645 RepID=UPI002B40F920|nr:disease resistance protein RUN1-like [Rosa rugosa]
MALSGQRASTSVPLSFSWKFDVFLSFRGETRKTFTEHLYNALQRRAIKVFWDLQLEKGTTISSELMTAIEESRYETKFIKEIVESLYNKLVCAGCNSRIDNGLSCWDLASKMSSLQTLQSSIF